MSVTVFLEEECGYRYWLWETGMDADALMAWWSDLPAVDEYFFDPRGLPGKLTSLYDLTESPYEIEAILTDSSLTDDEKEAKLTSIVEAPSRWIKVEDNQLPNPAAEVLDIPALTGGWRAHVHMNDDSWIMPPEKQRHYLSRVQINMPRL